MSDKAKRATISLGELEVDGFQMPDGSYRMSQTQVAEAVGLSERNARDFLQSKGFKALMGKGYTPAISDIEVEQAPNQRRGQTRIKGLGIAEVSAYWLWQAYRGNKKALTFCLALMAETLERRFDAAFGLERSETERNQRLSQRIQQLDQEVRLLNEAFSTEDLLREENAYLQNQIRQMGGEPWQLPAPEQADE